MEIVAYSVIDMGNAGFISSPVGLFLLNTLEPT